MNPPTPSGPSFKTRLTFSGRAGQPHRQLRETVAQNREAHLRRSYLVCAIKRLTVAGWTSNRRAAWAML